MKILSRNTSPESCSVLCPLTFFMRVIPTEAQNQLHVEYFLDIEDYFKEIVL